MMAKVRVTAWRVMRRAARPLGEMGWGRTLWGLRLRLSAFTTVERTRQRWSPAGRHWGAAGQRGIALSVLTSLVPCVGRGASVPGTRAGIDPFPTGGVAGGVVPQEVIRTPRGDTIVPCVWSMGGEGDRYRRPLLLLPVWPERKYKCVLMRER